MWVDSVCSLSDLSPAEAEPRWQNCVCTQIHREIGEIMELLLQQQQLVCFLQTLSVTDSLKQHFWKLIPIFFVSKKTKITEGKNYLRNVKWRRWKSTHGGKEQAFPGAPRLRHITNHKGRQAAKNTQWVIQKLCPLLFAIPSPAYSINSLNLSSQPPPHHASWLHLKKKVVFLCVRTLTPLWAISV